MTLNLSIAFHLAASSGLREETVMRRPATAMRSAARVAIPMRRRFETFSASAWRFQRDHWLYGFFEGLMELESNMKRGDAMPQSFVDQALHDGDHLDNPSSVLFPIFPSAEAPTSFWSVEIWSEVSFASPEESLSDVGSPLFVA